MPKSIAVFGAGSGLGQAVARRYGREGYDVVLVARRREPLEQLAKDLSAHGVIAHVITADLSDTDAVPTLAEQIRSAVGHLDVLYYGPAGGDAGFTPAADPAPGQLADLMPLMVYTPLALVREFLPRMLERGEGAVLTAQGASALAGVPNMSGPGPATAAQRNYLQSLQAEVGDKGVYIGRIYVGALIGGSAMDEKMQAARATGAPVPDWQTVAPATLADLLWNMHTTGTPSETIYPEGLFDH
ncbi:SDR family NAD(P)-dependent oxidoreductase [Streptosporangium sp. G12]